MPSTGHFPPPSRPDERYRAVIERGRRLQRRDRMTKGLVTGGIAAVVVLVVLAGAFALSGGTPEDDPVASSTTSATTETTVAPDELAVAVTAVDDVVEVDVDDAMVDLTDDTKACVLLRLQEEGPARVASAESFSCWQPGDGDGPTETELVLVDVEVGCSATVDRPDPEAAPPSTVPGAIHHTFRFRLPAGLASGTYVAEATAVVGTGDGCPGGAPDGEELAEGKTAVTVP